MRQVFVQVPRGEGRTVLDMGERHGAANATLVAAEDGNGPRDLVVLAVPNGEVEGLLEDLDSLADVYITLVPRGVLPLQPPAHEAPQQVVDVQSLSPIEVLLEGLQSVGSWQSFLGYAVLAGIVVWIGFYTNTSYLLVGAMLIAPFAGPAMNVALATARGDLELLKRGIGRYFAALATTIATTWLLSLLFGQKAATPQMVARSVISSTAVLLPLAAGAAGALNLMQSNRSSLVSGTAVGMLVAASLAPPAGLVGMSAALGHWDVMTDAAFLLLLQLVGINLTGSTVFRVYGLSASGARYSRGEPRVHPWALGVSVLVIAGLLAWQFHSRPDLQRSSRAQRAVALVTQTLERHSLAHPVMVQATFTRPQIPGQNTLLVRVHVQPKEGVALPESAIQERLIVELQEAILAAGFHVTPLVDVTVLRPPSTTGATPPSGSGSDRNRTGGESR